MGLFIHFIRRNAISNACQANAVESMLYFFKTSLSTSPFMFCWNGQLGIRKTYFMYYLSILHFLYFYCILKCSASYLYWSINFAFFIFFLLIIQDSNSSISPQGTIYVPEGPIQLFLYLLLYFNLDFFLLKPFVISMKVEA